MKKEESIFKENKDYRRPVKNDDLFWFKRLGSHTFDDIQFLVEIFGFNDDNQHSTYRERVDNLKPFEDVDHGYVLIIHFSYKSATDSTSSYQDFDVYYDDDDEDNFSYYTRERMYLDNILVRHYYQTTIQKNTLYSIPMSSQNTYIVINHYQYIGNIL